ncbi:hypothetical protein J2T07_001250 [Luteibacter jiangsuensis]|uniref:Transcriptional regulator with AbiEi antitoxin domain of type IV toxin-antitoxin system n=1 Tax=Luteibacter jiangsuensis TaxID=637577 RepID=A0ABT9SVP8_9GAMM|nr:type IV toxin-antitoxin system AbiEi family antitoxin [Luteibacter jiangsuensis]MDQ0009073.1 hypothetical protein [Luteibacter jiangsuensis]
MSDLTLIRDAAQAVEATTGLPIHILPAPDGSGGYRPDGIVTVGFPDGILSFVAECKARIIGNAQLVLIKQHLATYDDRSRPLLVTHHLTSGQIDHCREIDLDFMDTAGNCLLREGPRWVLVRGNRPTRTNAPSPYRGGTSYASLRVVYALLCHRPLLSAPYRELAMAAGVSLGAIPPIFADLEQRGLVSARDGDKRRHFLALDRLQSEWVTNFPHKLRPRLGQRRFSALAPDWWKDADLGSGALWGGEVAAHRLNGFLRPITQTIYLSEGVAGDAINPLLRKYRLRADPTGAIEFVERFWHFDDTYAHTQGIVNPLLIYADLLTMKDSRAAEAASLIWKDYVGA